MKRLFWWRQTASSSLQAAGKKHKTPSFRKLRFKQSITSPHIFVMLPQNRTQQRPVYTNIFVQMPAAPGSSQGPQPRMWWREAMPGVIAAMAAGASLFALIGMLHLMVATPQIRYALGDSLISPSQRLLPKKNPHKQDAFSTEYQHAITTEWIDARDTALFAGAISNKPRHIKAARNKMITVTPNHKRAVRNLAFTVHNGSTHTLERVKVEVDYLNSNGRLLLTETYAVHRVAPGKDKTIKVPKDTPGKRFRHRIVEVKSHSYTTTLQHL